MRSWGMLTIVGRHCPSEEVADPAKRRFVLTRRSKKVVRVVIYVLAPDNRY